MVIFRVALFVKKKKKTEKKEMYRLNFLKANFIS